MCSLRTIEFTRVLAVALMWFLAAAPAVADQDLDAHCSADSRVTQQVRNECAPEWPRFSLLATIKQCLASHADAFTPTASSCIAAAQAHYGAAYGNRGYLADAELGVAAVELRGAAEANAYLFHTDLAITQARTAESVFTRIMNGPEAGAQGRR